MRIDWMPFSASALVAGATALSVGSILLPSSDNNAQLLQLVQDKGGLWMAAAALYFLSSVALVLGMPAVLTMFDRRGSRTGMAAIGVFTIGCVGIAGFAMLLAFIHALVINNVLTPATLDTVVTEPQFAVFLYGWIAAFYLGELLLAIALFQARTTSLWIPGLLLVHVLLFPVNDQLPQSLQSLTALLITVALSGVGIAANNRHSRPVI